MADNVLLSVVAPVSPNRIVTGLGSVGGYRGTTVHVVDLAYHVGMAVLGELENRVMEVLWRMSAPASVRQVHTVLAAERDLAYTTVMTVLDRLAKKALVSRARDGRQWLYSVRLSREDLIAGEVMEMLTGTPEQRQAVLAEVVRRLAPDDRRALAALLQPEHHIV